MNMLAKNQRPGRTDGNIVVRVLYGSEDCAVAGSRGPSYGSDQPLVFEALVRDDRTPGASVASTLNKDELSGCSTSTDTVDGRLHLNGY